MTHENAEDLTANVLVGRSVRHRSTIEFARYLSYDRTATVDKIAHPMGNPAFCRGSGCRRTALTTLPQARRPAGADANTGQIARSLRAEHDAHSRRRGDRIRLAMSAIGTKQTYQVAAHMYPLSGVKRTWRFALQMSANDPKRTSSARWSLVIGARLQICAHQILPWGGAGLRIPRRVRGGQRTDRSVETKWP